MHQYTPHPKLKQQCFLGLECVATNQEIGICYNLQSSKCGNQDEKKLKNTSRGVRLDFHEKGPFKKLEFYRCAPSVVAATTTLQNFALASF